MKSLMSLALLRALLDLLVYLRVFALLEIFLLRTLSGGSAVLIRQTTTLITLSLVVILRLMSGRILSLLRRAIFALSVVFLYMPLVVLRLVRYSSLALNTLQHLMLLSPMKTARISLWLWVVMASVFPDFLLLSLSSTMTRRASSGQFLLLLMKFLFFAFLIKTQKSGTQRVQ